MPSVSLFSSSLALMKDEVLRPLAAERMEFCEMDLFPENLSYAADLSFPSDVDMKYSSEPLESTELQNHPNENRTSSSTFAATTTEAIIDNNTLSVIFDSQDELDNTISSSIDFSTSPSYTGATHQDQLDFTEENCLSMILLLNPSASSSYTFVDPSMDSLPGTLNATLAAEVQTKEPECFGPDQLQPVYSSSDIQNDKQRLVNGAVSTPMPTEILTLEDSAFKAGKLSVEERKEKIHRYLKKRNERNFNKKIKYACRKTLADSRPRVRGRFARNDYFA